jgi:hypothetical protein
MSASNFLNILYIIIILIMQLEQWPVTDNNSTKNSISKGEINGK